MEGIRHRTLEVNGISMHVAEAGEEGNPVVLLLHGFPELWYSWRHQIPALATGGYHAVAPDLRGYGATSSPPSPSSYSMPYLVGDLVHLVAALGHKQVFVVGHDWGAIVAYNFCLFRPDLVKALVTLSVAFQSRKPVPMKPLDYINAAYGDELYICRFQEPGVMEAEFTRIGTKAVLEKFLTYRTPGPLYIPKEGWGSPDDHIELPSWLSEEDVEYFARNFEKSGFTGGLNYYRAMNLSWELSAPWTGAQLKGVPMKFIVGDLDLAYHYPGIQDYINNGGMKRDVPLLEEVVVVEGAGHFINQEKPQEITGHILGFIKTF